MAAFTIARLVIFVFCTLFSPVVLGILCNFTSITSSAGFYYNSFALGIATALMTILFVVSSLVIEKFRRGAITSLVWFELIWMGLLWVLWLATAISVTSLAIFTSCGFVNSTVESNCQQYQVVKAFTWILWAFTSGWFVALLVMSVIAASKGYGGVWKTPVTEHPLFSKGGSPVYGNHTTAYPRTTAGSTYA